MADEPNKLKVRPGKGVGERPARGVPKPARAGLRAPRILSQASRPGRTDACSRSAKERHRLEVFRAFLGLLNVVLLLLAWHYRDVLFPLGNPGLGEFMSVAAILAGVPAVIVINFMVQMMLASALFDIGCPFWLLAIISLFCSPVSLGLIMSILQLHG